MNHFFDMSTSVNYIVQVFPLALTVTIVYMLSKCSKVRNNKIVLENMYIESAKLIFVFYFAGLIGLKMTTPNFWSHFWALLLHGRFDLSFQDFFSGAFSFRPTITFLLTGRITSGVWVKTLLIGNIIMFIPFGLLLPLIREQKTFRYVIKCCFFVSLIIEILQPILGRSFDIDDILCNVIGAIIGFCIFTVARNAPFAFSTKYGKA